MNPNPQTPPQKGWFARNWGWVLALGLGLPIMCCGGFGAFTYFTAKKMVETSGAYVDVMARTAVDSRISAALGEPVEPGLPTNSSVKESNGSGSASLEIPFKGSKASGTLHAEATKEGGSWKYSRLEMVLEDGTGIDLRTPPPEDAAPELPPPGMDEPEPTDDAPPADEPAPAD